MKNELKIVIDTNVFVSALLGNPTCKEIAELLKQKSFVYLTSFELLDELTKTLQKPKFINLNQDETNKFLRLIRKRAKIIFSDESITLCRDLKDNIVLECALAGKANFIVTGDKDLLALKKLKNISIITPKKFIKQLKVLT